MTKILSLSRKKRENEPLPKKTVKSFKKPAKKTVNKKKQHLFTYSYYMKGNDVLEARKLLQMVGDRFDFENPKILSKGITSDVKRFLKETLGISIPRHALHKAVAIYTKNPRYTAAYKVGAKRYNIKGEVDGIVTAEDYKHYKHEMYILEAKMKFVRNVKAGNFEKAKAILEDRLGGKRKLIATKYLELYDAGINNVKN